MKTAVHENYKPTRYEGKGFLRNLNIRIHRDITGDRCGLGGVFFLTYLLIKLNSLFVSSVSRFFNQFLNVFVRMSIAYYCHIKTYMFVEI